MQATNNELSAAIADMIIEAMDISYGIYQDLESLRDCYDGGELTEDEVRDQLLELRERLDEADAA